MAKKQQQQKPNSKNQKALKLFLVILGGAITLLVLGTILYFLALEAIFKEPKVDRSKAESEISSLNYAEIKFMELQPTLEERTGAFWELNKGCNNYGGIYSNDPSDCFVVLNGSSVNPISKKMMQDIFSVLGIESSEAIEDNRFTRLLSDECFEHNRADCSFSYDNQENTASITFTIKGTELEYY